MNKIPWLKPRARSLATNYLLGMQSNGPDKSITISPFYFMNGSFFHFSMIFWKTLMKMDNNRDIWFLLFTDFVSFINVRKSSKNRNWSVVFLNISRCFWVVCWVIWMQFYVIEIYLKIVTFGNYLTISRT